MVNSRKFLNKIKSGILKFWSYSFHFLKMPKLSLLGAILFQYETLEDRDSDSIVLDIILVIVSVFNGVIMVIQASLNRRLVKYVKNPWRSAWFSFLTGMYGMIKTKNAIFPENN